MIGSVIVGYLMFAEVPDALHVARHGADHRAGLLVTLQTRRASQARPEATQATPRF